MAPDLLTSNDKNCTRMIKTEYILSFGITRLVFWLGLTGYCVSFDVNTWQPCMSRSLSSFIGGGMGFSRCLTVTRQKSKRRRRRTVSREKANIPLGVLQDFAAVNFTLF